MRALRDALSTKERLLANKGLLGHLPDKGARLVQQVEALRAELEEVLKPVEHELPHTEEVAVPAHTAAPADIANLVDQATQLRVSPPL